MKRITKKVIVFALIFALALSTPATYAATQFQSPEIQINEMNYEEVMQLYAFLEDRFNDIKNDISSLDKKTQNLE